MLSMKRGASVNLKDSRMVSGYARMWPRAIFYTKALNEFTGRKRGLSKELDFLKQGGVYALYWNDTPYYVGKAAKLRSRLSIWADKTVCTAFSFLELLFSICSQRFKETG
jgi:hypothetical protein